MFSAFNPSKCTHLEQWAANTAVPREQFGGSVPCSRVSPQSWTIPEPRFEPTTSGYKSDALSITATTAPLRDSECKYNIEMLSFMRSNKLCISRYWIASLHNIQKFNFACQSELQGSQISLSFYFPLIIYNNTDYSNLFANSRGNKTSYFSLEHFSR